MSAVAAYQTGNMQVPHRKPLPSQAPVNSRLQPLTRIVPDSQQQQQQQQQYNPQYNQYQQPQQQQQTQISHNRASTTSSSGYSQMAPPGGQQYSQNTNPVSYQAHMNAFNPTTKRSLSNATASTSSTGGGGSGPGVANRRASSSSSYLQRTASSRSGGGQPSYVQMLRKQKATVWSDRTQYEDPRVVQQQRAAKMRAAMEVSGSHVSHSSTAGLNSLTGGIRSKVRHHGAPKATVYGPNTHPAIGVPVRLSANEIDEDEDEQDDDSNFGFKGSQHHRSGSARSKSSNGSGARNSSIYGLHPPQQSQSSGVSRGSTPGSSTAQGHSPNQPSPASSQRRRTGSLDFDSSDPTPVPESHQKSDYFSRSSTRPEAENNNSPGGTSRENSFGQVGDLPVRAIPPASNEPVDLAELRRRGSVDERTMTMSGYSRLFVANPDLE